MKTAWSRADLVDLQPKHRLLIAIDSDGCVFDSMTIKQRIFHSGMIRAWGLGAWEREFRLTAEWTALYSPWRGLNRFELLLRILQHFNQLVPQARPAPQTGPLEAFVASGVPLSADELAQRAERTGDPELRRALEWSRQASREIAAVAEMPVFAGVRAGLEALRAEADLVVVSQTAEEALVREWRNAGLSGLTDVIAGAELGSKIESLSTAMAGRYLPEHTLMVGDAPGDLETARATGALFFPIIPGDEAASWDELRSAGLERLKSGRFDEAYQEGLIARFREVLSETPPRMG